MKIRHIYTYNFGPFQGEKHFDLQDDWNKQTVEHILFSGPNGCGKSNMLRLIAYMWDASGYWLRHPKYSIYRRSPKLREWFKYWDGYFSIIIESLLPDVHKPIGLILGAESWYNILREKHPDVLWFGEIFDNPENTGIPTMNRLHPASKEESAIIETWSREREKLILGKDADTPNIIHLDTEETRWVKPRSRVGEIIPENPERWLYTYKVTEDWQGQLEQSLISLKIIDEPKYLKVLQDINSLLEGKEIDKRIHEEDNNRLRVNIKNIKNSHHKLDELSAGERRVIILVYTVSRRMEQNGIVLIDEPDLFLHPSLIPSLLAKLESIVSERNGQLIITSHNPNVWRRYENIGKRILLGEI